MSNNRLIISHPETGKEIVIAKGWGKNWEPVADLSLLLRIFFSSGEEVLGIDAYATDVNGKTSLLLKTEYDNIGEIG